MLAKYKKHKNKYEDVLLSSEKLREHFYCFYDYDTMLAGA